MNQSLPLPSQKPQFTNVWIIGVNYCRVVRVIQSHSTPGQLDHVFFTSV